MKTLFHIASTAVIAITLLVSPSLQAAPFSNLSDAVAAVRSTAVSISALSVSLSRRAALIDPFPPNSPWHALFQQGLKAGAPVPPESIYYLGSGVIVGAQGYILTTASVVSGTAHLRVTLDNRQTYPAQVVGISRRYDIALLKIPARDLPVVRIGQPGQLRIGQRVFAVGNHFGLGSMVSQGIISRVDRPLTSHIYVPFIQTDLPIDPENSGSPLFNRRGQLIGINDPSLKAGWGSGNPSFSIPIQVAMRVVNAFEAGKPLTFGWMGVSMQTVTPEIASAFHLKESLGALVNAVDPGGPAAQAGLHRGDIVIAFDGVRIKNVGLLAALVAQTPPGTIVPLSVIQQGQRRARDIRIGTEGPHRIASQMRLYPVPLLGLVVAPIDAQIKAALQVTHGVVVVDVHPGAAKDAGIRPGMVIEQILWHTIDSPKQLNTVLATLPVGKPLPILLATDSGSAYVALRLGHQPPSP